MASENGTRLPGTSTAWYNEEPACVRGLRRRGPRVASERGENQDRARRGDRDCPATNGV